MFFFSYSLTRARNAGLLCWRAVEFGFHFLFSIDSLWQADREERTKCSKMSVIGHVDASLNALFNRSALTFVCARCDFTPQWVDVILFTVMRPL